MALEFASRKATFPNYRKFETTFRPPVCGGNRQALRPCQWQRNDPLWRNLRAVQCYHERKAA